MALGEEKVAADSRHRKVAPYFLSDKEIPPVESDSFEPEK